MTRLLACLIVALGALWSGGARAAEADLWCQTGTSSTGAPIFVQVTPSAPCPVTIGPTSSANAGIVPVVAGSAVSSSILKAGPGNLYGAYATCSAACFLMVFNSTTAPVNGSTVAGTASGNMQDCISIASGATGSINYAPGPPEVFSVGITAVISSTGCPTLTLATTGFITGSAK